MHHRSIRRAALMTMALAALAGPAFAEYPDHTINDVVPFTPGGATDLLGRLYATYLEQDLGQRVVIENKGGAGGTIGISEVAHSKPDGYTLLSSSTASTESPALYKKLPFDPINDIVPVAELAAGPLMIVINAQKVPVDNLKDFIALMKKNPGKYNAGAGGSGTRLSVELFKLNTGFDADIVSYDSAGASATALLTGETDFSIVDAAAVGPLLAGGKVKMLAVASDKRLAGYPDVPTTAEAGVSDYKDAGVFGIYARAGTPKDIIEKLNAKLLQIDAKPEVLAKLQTLGWTALPMNTAKSLDYYRTEIGVWKDIVAKAHIPTSD